MANFQIPSPIPDTKDAPLRLFPDNDISHLDEGNFADFNPLPPNERTRILNRQGTNLTEADVESLNPHGRHIVAALDFKYEEHVNAVLTQAKGVAKQGDTIVLFNVISKSADSAELQAMRTRSDTRLADISKIAREFEEGVEVLTHLVHGRPEKELLKCMNTHHASLIILGKRKLKGLKKVTSTSVSDEIIARANCSVLIAK